jgi:hypothetical protein
MGFRVARPNGLPISRAAADRSGKRVGRYQIQKSDDLVDAQRRRLHPTITRVCLPHQMTGRLLFDPVWRGNLSSPWAGWAA